MFAAAFVILMPVAIWLYTLVFAFSSLWFAHYSLAALEQLRQERDAMPDPTARSGHLILPVLDMEALPLPDVASPKSTPSAV
jgi:hypothetical protein